MLKFSPQHQYEQQHQQQRQKSFSYSNLSLCIFIFCHNGHNMACNIEHRFSKWSLIHIHNSYWFLFCLVSLFFSLFFLAPLQTIHQVFYLAQEFTEKFIIYFVDVWCPNFIFFFGSCCRCRFSLAISLQLVYVTILKYSVKPFVMWNFALQCKSKDIFDASYRL